MMMMMEYSLTILHQNEQLQQLLRDLLHTIHPSQYPLLPLGLHFEVKEPWHLAQLVLVLHRDLIIAFAHERNTER